MVLAALVLVLLMGPALPRAAAADCPTNSISALGTHQISSNPSGSVSQNYTCTADGFPVRISGSASYNLPMGHVTFSGSGGIGCSGSGQVATRDVFTLSGPASGSPLSLRAELGVNASGYGYAGGSVTLREGASNTSPSSPFPGSSTIGITIQVSPGSSFDLYIEGGAGGGFSGQGTAAVDAWLGFPDLPPGYLLTSCQGFTAGIPVPVRATSWGQLKNIYR